MAESSLVRRVDRYFVWVVVMVATLDVVGQAFDSWVQGRLLSVAVWTALGLIMLISTYGLEMVKSRREP